MDQNRHKVKRQRGKKKKKKAGIITQTEQTESAPPTLATWTGELFSSAQLHPGVGHDSKELMASPWQASQHCPGWCLRAHRRMYTCRLGHIKGLYSQTPLPSPSCLLPSAAVHVPGGSGGALTPALCGWRGHQSGRDPENPPHTYPTLRHSCHTAVDMLSPGDMPSNMGCSVDCGLEADRLTLGG